MVVVMFPSPPREISVSVWVGYVPLVLVTEQELILLAHAPLVGDSLEGLVVMLGVPVMLGAPVMAGVREGVVEKVLVGVAVTGVKEGTKELLDVSYICTSPEAPPLGP